MCNPADVRTNLLRSVVFFIAYLTIADWGLSFLHSLNWAGALGGGGIVLTIIFARRWAGPINGWRKGLGEPLAFWPLILILILLLLGAAIYPITMLDSLSYRVPRLLLWLQEGCIYHVATPDARINYMPQLWDLVSLPLIQLFGIKLAYFWSFVSWVAIYLVGYDWAFEFCGEVKKSRMLTFLGSTSAFGVLQATSTANDVFATALVLLALHFILVFERTRERCEIGWAVLSLGMATGVKTHFAVLGLPLIIWFFASPSKPWKIFQWKWLPVLLPLWLGCSVVPTFLMNYHYDGSWAGPKEARQELLGKSHNRIWNVTLGTTLIVWQASQPPINPVALFLNEQLNTAVTNYGIDQHVPRFRLKMYPLTIVDAASLGLVTVILLVGGVFLALKQNRALIKSWPGWVTVAGVGSLLLALSEYVPWSAGRIYCGFLFLFFPLAMTGWNLFRARTLRLMVYLCLLNSLVILIFDPARPFWPAGWVQQTLVASSRFEWLTNRLKLYLQFPERAHTGEAVMQAIPPGEVNVVVLMGKDRPLLPLFYPLPSKHRIITLLPHATADELNETAVNYVIVGGGAKESYPELCDYLDKSGVYTLVLSHDYTPMLVRGVETWKLYRRASVKSAVPPSP